MRRVPLAALLLVVAVPCLAHADDAVRLLRLAPSSGEILGTWDVRDGWATRPGSYVEAEIGYTLETAALGSVNWSTGLPHTAVSGWTLFKPGTGTVVARLTRMCEEPGASTPLASTLFRYFLSESTSEGATIRTLASGSRATALSFVCPDRTRPDLAVRVNVPLRVAAGRPLPVGTSVTVRNRGGVTAPGTLGVVDPLNGYHVDIILSRDTTVPEGYARVSETFVEDALLLGGRVSRTPDLPSALSQTYRLDGISLPADTPPGAYYLCARVDPGRRIAEADETNNAHCARVIVGDLFIDFEQYTQPRALPGTDAVTLYSDLGVTFPSHPRIFGPGSPISSGFQALVQGDVSSPRPSLSCGPLDMRLSSVLRARRVRLEARNVGFIDLPILITVTAFDAAGAVVDTWSRVNVSRLGDLRPYELVQLESPAGSGDIRRVTVQYGTCPPFVVIDNVWVRGAE